MDFVFVKSIRDGDMGTINCRYVTPFLSNMKDMAPYGKKCKSASDVDIQIKKKNRSGKRTKVSLGISLTKEEWNSYSTGVYQPNKEIKSLGITYDKFSKFMEMVRRTVSESRDEQGMKFIVQRAMLKLITEN